MISLNQDKLDPVSFLGLHASIVATTATREEQLWVLKEP